MKSSELKGSLYVFEGPDGFGKTTLASTFARRLGELGRDVRQYSFPGREEGTLGSVVYGIHHSPPAYGIVAMDATALQLLHLAAHVDNVNRVLRPLLLEGTSVVLDRFWWSLAVYGKVLGADTAILAHAIEIERTLFDPLRPQCVFLLMSKRFLPRMTEQIDSNTAKLLREYDALAATETGLEVIRIDNNDSPDAVVETALTQSHLV